MTSINSLGNLTSSCPRRVLVVEDNRDGRNSLKWLLEEWGYEVQVAEDGKQGVEKILDYQPEVAIVDIGLPYLSGYQVARQVRAVLKDRIRLIALTAYGESEDRQKAMEAGFDVHITKPASLRELSRVLAG